MKHASGVSWAPIAYGKLCADGFPVPVSCVAASTSSDFLLVETQHTKLQHKQHSNDFSPAILSNAWCMNQYDLTDLTDLTDLSSHFPVEAFI